MDWEAHIQHCLFSIIHAYKRRRCSYRRPLGLIPFFRHYVHAFKWKDKNFILLLRHKGKHLLDEREFKDTCMRRHFLTQERFTFQKEYHQPLPTLCLLDLHGRSKHTVRTDKKTHNILPHPLAWTALIQVDNSSSLRLKPLCWLSLDSSFYRWRWTRPLRTKSKQGDCRGVRITKATLQPAGAF